MESQESTAAGAESRIVWHADSANTNGNKRIRNWACRQTNTNAPAPTQTYAGHFSAHHLTHSQRAISLRCNHRKVVHTILWQTSRSESERTDHGQFVSQIADPEPHGVGEIFGTSAFTISADRYQPSTDDLLSMKSQHGEPTTVVLSAPTVVPPA